MRNIFTYIVLIILAFLAAFIFLALTFHIMDKQDKFKQREWINNYFLEKRQWQRNYI